MPFAQPNYVRNEEFTGDSLLLDAPTIASFTQPSVADDVFYTCGEAPVGRTGYVIPSGTIDLGPKLTLSGSGKSLDAFPDGTIAGHYSAQIKSLPGVSSPNDLGGPFFAPGIWAVHGEGGKDTAAFAATLTIPPPIRNVNFFDLQTIDRQRDTIVRWDPTGYTADDVMTINVEGVLTIPDPTVTVPDHGPVTCQVRATDGQIALPPSLFGTAALSPQYVRLTLTKRPDRITTVSIPLTSGGAIPAVFKYTGIEILPILIK